MTAQIPEKSAMDRERYVRAWNKLMIDIWKEKIIKVDAIDTTALYNSAVEIGVVPGDEKFMSVTLSQAFNAYGIFVNYGTGREVYRGNKGNIGLDRNGNPNGILHKNRKAKPWFSPKYAASVYNLRDFYADSLGEEGAMIIARALNDDTLRADLL